MIAQSGLSWDGGRFLPVRSILPFKHEEYQERWKEDLRKAGIPEKPP